ncbi:ABC transporter ATP-binding protein [Fusibacter paucivorans]|uniref:ABC transporter ATP-binding protein n=1 Tax=Fusibacter paucivorans TaxID=76009 RepID=A0ABS5PN32_9FIRM|nr:ABC transporter ATP-binding protein [Fusibacter paucivorans]MBS7526585.1 ABC transporter ATP-binding protein [Fusibacter paucivorans]
MSVIKCEDLSFAYGTQRVLEGVSFHIEKGEKIGIIGLNGSGKSTLLRLMIGLLKAESGTMHVLGMPVQRKNLKALHRRVGYVFQNVDEQLFMPTVYDDIAFGLKGILPVDKVSESVEAILKRFHIMHLRDKAPFQLSGGEKRAVAIATVMVMAPEIVLMDEPTEGLDARMRRKMTAFVKASPETFVISSHDSTFIRDICDRVIVLKAGHLIRIDTPEVLFDDFDFLEANELI